MSHIKVDVEVDLMSEKTVTLDLCCRVGKEYKCKTDGFKARYKKGQVGPHSVEITYPS